MSINLNCIYHKERPMVVVNDEKYQALLATGEWFAHPSLPSSVPKEKEKEKVTKPKGRSKKGAEAAAPSATDVDETVKEGVSKNEDES